MDQPPAAPLYPLYQRTFTLYRVSPLHTGDTSLLDEPTLKTHARRLREQLKGDNVRGVEVDFAGAEDALPRIGPLQECSWAMLPDEDTWIDQNLHFLHSEISQVPSEAGIEQMRGVFVSLEYEKATYHALLLRDPTTTTSPEAFTSLPLLLVRMPLPVREIFLNYLRTSFDAHVAPLRLSSNFITSSIETYFRHFSAGNSPLSIVDAVKQVQIQLSFPTVTTLLRHLDITIQSAYVPGFVSRGRLLKGGDEKPFTAALSSYMSKHLALDMANPKVQVSRVSCGSFTLATDRIKISLQNDLADTSTLDGSSISDVGPGQLVVKDLYSALVREATPIGKFLIDDAALSGRSSTPSSIASARVGRRKRAVSSTAANTRNTKRSKVRGEDTGREDEYDDDIDEIQS